MKQLTMTKVLTPIAALAFAFGVQAATVSDGFEAFTAGDDGTVITNNTGWSFTPAPGPDAADDASTVEAYPSPDTEPTSKPTSYSEAFASAGDKFLKLSTEDGMLFRKLSDTAASASVGAGLYVDTDVQFTITDPSDRPTPTQDDKFIIWLEDQGSQTNLCAFARQVAADGTVVSTNYTLVGSSDNSLGIVPGTWHRLTVKAITDANAGGSSALPGFQVYLDGVIVYTREYAVASASTLYGNLTAAAQTLVDNRTFLPAMTDSMDTLEKVGFSGEGKIDNLAISSDIPEFLPRQKVTVSWDTSIISAVTLRHGGESTTLTNSPGVVIVDSLTDITIANDGDIAFVGSSAYDFTDPSTWTKSGVSLSLSQDGKTLTSAAGNINNGSFTIGVEANNKCTLTLSANNDADLSSVSYVITSGGVAGETETISDLGDLVLGGVEIECLFGDVVTFTVVPVSGKSVTLSSTSGGTLSGNAFTVASDAHTADVSITTASSKATVDGVGYASFESALAAAHAAGTAKTVVLDDDAALESAAAIVSGDDITIDLAGNDITGADGAAVFTVAAGGTLTITNSTVAVGQVDADTGDACISNAGTLNLQAGKFSGAITGGTINVTGGAYKADAVPADANYPTGQTLVLDSGEASVYQYKLGAATYTISYLNEDGTAFTDWATSYTAPATYTMADAVTLPTSSDVDLQVVGVSFGGWTNETGTVTGWAVGQTGNVTVYAKLDPIVPSGEEIAPGEQSSTVYTTQADAEAALAKVTIAPDAAVTNGMDSAAAAAYVANFEAKVVTVEGGYKVEVALTAAAETALQSQANADVATIAAGITGSGAISITATPGFYYSLKEGTTLTSLTEGSRTLATGSTVSLTPTKSGTTGFYKVVINITDK